MSYVEPGMDPYRHMTVKHHFIGGIYTKELHLPVGLEFGQHRHPFDHQSVLVSGTAVLDVEGVRTEHTGPVVMNIRARKFHTITALTPVVWLCQHVTACTDPDDIDSAIVGDINVDDELAARAALMGGV